MDERTGKIKDLEAKKQADINTRNRLLEGLGETLFQRIGEGTPFDSDTGETSAGREIPSGALAEYRGLQKEIADSGDKIKTLEEELSRLRELEETLSAGEKEKVKVDAELDEACTELGKILLEDPDFHDATGPVRQQEETLLAKIDEQELKLEELERRTGGVLSWLGKNAQITMSKTLLLKNRAALRRLYRSAGEKFLSVNRPELLSGEHAEAAGKAGELKARVSSLAADNSGLKAERRKIADRFGAEGSPSRRIHGLEKHIADIKGKFPAVHLRMGSIASGDNGRELLSGFLKDEDTPVLEEAGRIQAGIAETESAVEKIRAAITIDSEKVEIEKIKKAINSQLQKISAAQETIAGHEKQIAETERHIEELRAFIENSAAAGV